MSGLLAGDEQGTEGAGTGPEQLGRRLAAARQKAGLAVEEVAQRIRVRTPVARDIEAGDYARCGGEVYAKGHIRAMAKVVGVDAEALIAEFLVPKPVEKPASRAVPIAVRGKNQARVIRAASESAAAPASVPVAAETVGAETAGAAPERAAGPAAPVKPIPDPIAAPVPSPPPVMPASRKKAGKKSKAGVVGTDAKGANWTAAMLVVLLGLIVFAGMQLFGGHDGPAAKPGGAAPAHSTTPAPTTPQPHAAPAPVAAPAGVAFRIAATDTASWVTVTSSDGKKLFDNLLAAGAVQTFQDGKQLAVTLGNASAVRIQVNGKDYGPAGADGQVVHLTVNPGSVVAG